MIVDGSLIYSTFFITSQIKCWCSSITSLVKNKQTLSSKIPTLYVSCAAFAYCLVWTLISTASATKFCSTRWCVYLLNKSEISRSSYFFAKSMAWFHLLCKTHKSTAVLTSPYWKKRMCKNLYCVQKLLAACLKIRFQGQRVNAIRGENVADLLQQHVFFRQLFYHGLQRVVVLQVVVALDHFRPVFGQFEVLYGRSPLIQKKFSRHNSRIWILLKSGNANMLLFA